MPRRRRSTMSGSTFGIIHRRGLLLRPLLHGILSVILVAGFVSALPSYPQEAPSLSADGAAVHAHAHAQAQAQAQAQQQQQQKENIGGGNNLGKRQEARL